MNRVLNVLILFLITIRNQNILTLTLIFAVNWNWNISIGFIRPERKVFFSCLPFQLDTRNYPLPRFCLISVQGVKRRMTPSLTNSSHLQFRPFSQQQSLYTSRTSQLSGQTGKNPRPHHESYMKSFLALNSLQILC